MKDLKRVVADADDLMKEVAGATADGFSTAYTHAEGRLGEVRHRLDDARLAVTEKVKSAANATNEYVRENPWKTLGVSVAAGLLVGLLFRRR